MVRRVLTSIVLIPAIVAAVLWAPTAALAALAALVLLLALDEFFRLAERQAMHGYRFWTMLCALGLLYAQWAAGSEMRRVGGDFVLIRGLRDGTISIEALFVIFVFGTVLLGVFGKRSLSETVPAIAASSAAILLIALPFSYTVRMMGVERAGRQILLFTLCLVWAGDMLAYFIGKFAGRIPLAPLLSPKKTWEGAAANLGASLIVGLFFARWIGADVEAMLAVAAVANIAGQLGDLIESAYKRGAGLKDSGSILPGHGGVLDRIDSLILAAPAVWWTASLFLRLQK
jgi:phosphatidate cytidylyltransferase